MVNLPATLKERRDLSWSRWKRQPRLSEVQELWQALRVSLEILNNRLNRKTDENGRSEPLDPEIDRLLADCPPEERTFERLYEAKLRLAILMDDAEVRADAARRFVEAAQLGVPSATALQAQFNADSADEKARKALYLALLDDLHLRYQRRSLDRRERRDKSSTLNLIGFVLAIPAVFAMAFVLGPTWDPYEAFRLRIESLHIVAVVWFGLIGAYLSQMFALHGVLKTIEYDALATEFNISAVVFRLIIGALGALIMYFLIVGQFLDGELFPDWSEGQAWIVSRAGGEAGGNISIRGVPGGAGGATGTPATGPAELGSAKAIGSLSKEFAQLLIWSTIAGFSERLIPDRFAAMTRIATEGKPLGRPG